MLHFHLDWLDFAIVMTIYGTAKKECSKTFDQYNFPLHNFKKYITKR